MGEATRNIEGARWARSLGVILVDFERGQWSRGLRRSWHSWREFREHGQSDGIRWFSLVSWLASYTWQLFEEPHVSLWASCILRTTRRMPARLAGNDGGCDQIYSTMMYYGSTVVPETSSTLALFLMVQPLRHCIRLASVRAWLMTSSLIATFIFQILSPCCSCIFFLAATSEQSLVDSNTSLISYHFREWAWGVEFHEVSRCGVWEYSVMWYYTLFWRTQW